MKIVIITILLLASCLVASAEPVAVGGDFGRTWISNFLAQNHKPVEQNNSTNLTSWGGSAQRQNIGKWQLGGSAKCNKPAKSQC